MKKKSTPGPLDFYTGKPLDFSKNNDTETVIAICKGCGENKKIKISTSNLCAKCSKAAEFEIESDRKNLSSDQFSAKHLSAWSDFESDSKKTMTTTRKKTKNKKV